MPLQTFKSYKNDLFGDDDGDVLASESIPAAKPVEAAVPRPTTPQDRVKQQISLNQQKRLARLQVCFCKMLQVIATCVDANSFSQASHVFHNHARRDCWLASTVSTFQVLQHSSIWGCNQELQRHNKLGTAWMLQQGSTTARLTSMYQLMHS